MAINIVVTDGIAAGIPQRIREIGDAASYTAKHAAQLKLALKGIDTGGIKALSNNMVKQAQANLLNAKRAEVEARTARAASADALRQQTITEQTARQRLMTQAAGVRLATAQRLAAERTAQAAILTSQKQVAAQAAAQAAAARAAVANTRTLAAQAAAANVPALAANALSRSNSQASGAASGAQAAAARAATAAVNTQRAQAALNVTQIRGQVAASSLLQANARLATAQNNTAASAARVSAAQSNAAAAAARAQAAASRLAATNARTSATLTRLGAAHNAAARGANAQSAALVQLNRSASFLRSDGLRWTKVLFGLAGVGLTAAAVVSLSDAYTLLQNRLSVVTTSAGQVETATKLLAAASLEARTPVADMARAFVRFDLAMKPLGASQQEVIGMTSTVTKALRLGGATAGEAGSALLQLSQAFNKGKLDGDEFRSMMENAPILTEGFAKALGVTRGELLKLAPEGKITAQVMREGIAGAAEEITKKFEKMRWTMGDAFTYLRTNALMFFGELDKQIGLTAALTGAIKFLSDNLDTLTFAFMIIVPVAAAFVGAKMLGGLATFTAYTVGIFKAIGAIRLPLAAVIAGTTTWIRATAVAGGTMQAVFASATTRAIGLQMALVRVTAGMLAVGAAAARAGGAMVAMLSLGNVLLLLTALVAAAIAFGDEIIVAADSGATLRDYTLAAFSEIGGFVADVSVSMYNSFADAMGFSGKEATSFGDVLIGIFTHGSAVAAIAVDSILTMFDILWKSLKIGAYFIKDTFVNVFVGITNTITTMINGLINSLNYVLKIAGKAEYATIEYKEMSTDTVDAARELADTKRSTAAMEMREQMAERIAEGAAKRAKSRKQEALRGSGDNTVKTGDAAGKAAKDKKPKKSDEEKRADIMAKFNREQESAIKLAGLLNDEREKQSAIENLNNKMAEKGYKLLSTQEDAAVRALVARRLAAERLGQAMQAIYDDVVQPEKTRAIQMQALDRLLTDGTITAEKHFLVWQKMTDEYRSATEVLADFNKEEYLANQLLGKFGEDGAVASKIQELEQKARAMGQAFTDAMHQQAEASIRAQYAAQRANDALKAIYDETRGASADIATQTMATKSAYDLGYISLAAYTKKMQELAAAQGALNIQMQGVTQWTQPFRQAMLELTAEMPTLAEGLGTVIKDAMSSSIDGVGDTIANVLVNIHSLKQQMEDTLGHSVSTADVLKEQFKQVGAAIAQDMVSALIKLGIQWAIQATLGQSIAAGQMAATLAMNAGQAAALSAMWATPAALVSLATSGANSIGAVAGIQATFLATTLGSAISGGIGAVASAAGGGGVMVANGGLITGAGTSRSDSIPASLSNGEFVVNAQATRKNVDLLHALNGGANMSNATASGKGIKVTVINNAGGVEHEVRQGATPDEVVLIARAVAKETVRTDTGKQIQSDMQNPNSRTTQAVTGRTSARIRRT